MAPISEIPIDPLKSYSLVELIDLAEAHNPETCFAWERARAQAASLGVARSELYPILAATALSALTRYQNFSGTTIDRRTTGDFYGGLELSYTVFDFGARAGRITWQVTMHRLARILGRRDTIVIRFSSFLLLHQSSDRLE